MKGVGKKPILKLTNIESTQLFRYITRAKETNDTNVLKQIELELSESNDCVVEKACRTNDAVKLQYCIDNGYDINITSQSNNHSMLCVAYINNSIDCIPLLISNGLTHDIRTLIIIAFNQKYDTNIVKLWLENDGGKTDLSKRYWIKIILTNKKLSMQSKFERIHVFINAGCKFLYSNLIHYMVKPFYDHRFNQSDCITCLRIYDIGIKNGLNIHSLNIRKNNALMNIMITLNLMSPSKQPYVYSLIYKLIDDGIKISKRKVIGSSVVMLAVKHNDFHLVKYFIEKGVSVNDTDANGCNALYYATTVDMTRYLITKHGVNMNCINNNGIARIESTLYPIAKCMVKLGANIHLIHIDQERFTKLMIYHLKLVSKKLLEEIRLIATRGICNEFLCQTDDLDDIVDIPVNLLNIPYARMIDALQLYIYGTYPEHHPLYNKNMKKIALFDDDDLLDNVQKEKEKIIKHIETISAVIHLRLTRTDKGKQELEKIATKAVF
jgi:ankyrin repeat protein